MAFKPSLKRKAVTQNVEPNILPIMNLIVVLVPMLLSVAEFVHLSLLVYLPPPVEDVAESEGEGSGGEQGGGEAMELNLLLNANDSGFEISLFGETKGDNFKMINKLPDGEYDFDALHEELVRVKKEVVGAPIRTEESIDSKTGKKVLLEVFKYSDAQRIKISARGDLPWQVLVKIIDSARDYKEEDSPIKKPLFPTPMLGQIQ